MKSFILKALWLAFLLLNMYACKKGRIPEEPIVPKPRIDSSFLMYFQQTNGVIAGEGTTSLILNDGRTLWLFGKSHINDFVSSNGMMACTSNVYNAAMTSDNNFVMTTLNNGVNDFIPSNENGKWFTPLHAYQYADTVFVFAKKEGAAPNRRTYVAKFHFPDLQYLRVDSFLFNSTNFGYTVFLDSAKGFAYVYGLYQPNISSNNSLFLARFPMNSLHDKWQYYSKDVDAWVDPLSSVTALTQVPGENFSIRKVKEKFVLVTQDAGKTCNSGNKIYSQTAVFPYGPFLNNQLLYTIKDEVNGISPAAYGVTIHPQYINSFNELLITYAINGYEPCLSTCIGGLVNPDYYRIRTLRVGLKAIDLAY